MIRLPQPRITNDKGELIRLTPAEKGVADYVQRQVNDKFRNALAYEVNITTLTTIAKKIGLMKFFEIAPADYLPVLVGEGAWSSNITKFREFNMADEFETGVINLGGQNAKLASADAGVDALNLAIINWAKSIGWSLFDLQLAARNGNWGLIEAKEKARKKNWDLGIQRVAFLGGRGLGTKCLGLLTQGSGITNNTTRITKALKDMTPEELKAFQAGIIEDYRANNKRTAWPNRFIVPESDYNGLAAQASPSFPIKSVLQVLEEAFKTATRRDDFQILPLAYADAAYHATESGIAGKQVYALYSYDDEALSMNIPVDYQNTLANSLDNFSWQNAGLGQFTGVLVTRPRELMYFTYTA